MGFFDSIGSFFGGIGRSIARGARSVGSFISGAAKKVGDFITSIDTKKIGDIAGTVGDVARGIASSGIPIISTIARGVGMGADLVKRATGVAGKVKEGAAIAGRVGDALQNPSDVEGLVGAGRAAVDFGRGLRR